MDGKEIRELRKKLGLSQQLFAVLIGTSLPSISGWETNKHKPSHLALEKLEKIKENSGK